MISQKENCCTEKYNDELKIKCMAYYENLKTMLNFLPLAAIIFGCLSAKFFYLDLNSAGTS